MPAVLLRNRDELRPSPGTINADTLRVWTQMPPSREAIPTMPTGDVPFGDDEIAASKTFDVVPHAIHNADKLMANDHRHRNRFLRPCVPVINMHVRATDRCLQDADEHIIAADCRNRNILEPKARLGFRLHNGLHHFLHGTTLGQSAKQEKSFASGTGISPVAECKVIDVPSL